MWEIDKNRPICPQICEQICVKISKNEYKAGEKIPSVRDIAVEAGVNPNTVQKAFTILAEQGLLYSVLGSGMFVSDNSDRAANKIEELRKIKTVEYFEDMKLLGMNFEQIKDYIKGWNG